MPNYCSQCKTKLNFFSYSYRGLSDDGSAVVLCKKCRQDMVEKAQARYSPFQLSKGYTRIKAQLFLQVWRIPTFCVICSSQEDQLSKQMISLSNGTVTLSIPLYLCQRCYNYDFKPLEYIRYQLHASSLTLDIGNPAVAEKYVASLTAELSNIKRNVLENPDKIVETNIGKLPMSILHDSVAKLGVQDVKKVLPNDANFQR